MQKSVFGFKKESLVFQLRPRDERENRQRGCYLAESFFETKYPRRRTAEIATVWAGGTGNAQKVGPSTRMNFRFSGRLLSGVG